MLQLLAGLVIGVAVLLMFGMIVARKQRRVPKAPAPGPRDGAVVESYDRIELPLPNGSTIRVQPLRFKQVTHFWRLLQRAQAGDGKAFCDMLDEFPKAVGIEKEVDRLLPAEVWEVIDSFFSHRRSMLATPPGAKEPIPEKSP